MSAAPNARDEQPEDGSNGMFDLFVLNTSDFH